MINKAILQDAIAAYKRDFPIFGWEKEQYKWQAIKWFQDHWNIEAEDFAKMLDESLGKTYNLLNSGKYFAKNMITWFADIEPEYVREMFRNLFDETLEYGKRIKTFKEKADYALAHFTPEAKNHFQDEKAISIYLWLKYPDDYYIYKFNEVKNMLSCLESDYIVKKGKGNIPTAYKLYNEMLEVIKEDEELISLVDSYIREDCYPDPKYHTLTFDVGFYISRYFKDNVWYGKDFDPGLSVEDWKTLLKDDTVFTESSKEIMKRMKHYGGAATCVQLAEEYGETYGFYNAGSVHLAKRICQKRKISPQVLPDGNQTWWTMLYIGRTAKNDEKGEFVWKLRNELSSALDQVDLSKIELYAGDKSKPQNYWWMLCNPKIWDFAAAEVGFEQDYTLYNDNGNKRRIFQNFLDAKEGDVVFGYVSTPIKKLVGLAVVTKEQDGERLYFKKTEDFASPIDYSELKAVPEFENAEFMGGAQGSLFKVSAEEAEILLDMIAEANPKPVIKESKSYSSKDFLREVFLKEEDYNKLRKLLKRKKNVILQGAPGVGKTYSAKRLAYSIMGQEDDDRIKMVQFHQNYSYEDFIMGYRPDGDSFTLVTGVFYDFCKKAARDQGREYFFIIDEINRGNLSKIFGELLMLIEADHRKDKVQLAYQQEQFSVPENLYIIGMMNTADRSLALIDYALRRRFSFFTMKPDYQIKSFQNYQKQVNNPHFDALIRTVEDLNSAITDDSALGSGFCIGYSYFCDSIEKIDDDWINSVVEYDLIPTLEEYWFDDQTKVDQWSERLRNVTR